MGHNVCPTARSFPCGSKSRVGFAVPSWCLMMMTQASTALVDGSVQRPELSTTSVTGPSVASSAQHRPPCLIPKLAHMQRVSLQLAPLRLSSACRRPSFGRCFSGDCACRCPLHLQLAGLDVLGDHVAACPRSGVLRSRGGPLERPAASVCREAGATVQQHVLLRDLNVEPGRPVFVLAQTVLAFCCLAPHVLIFA